MQLPSACSRLFLSLFTALTLGGSTTTGDSLASHGRVVSRQTTQAAPTSSAFSVEKEDLLAMPAVGDHRLRILSPTVLELFLVTTQRPDSPVDTWDFVTAAGASHLPTPTQLRVTVDGKAAAVEAVGFRRRVLYAPLKPRDLRIGNYLSLRLAAPIPENTVVEVKSADAAVLPPTTRFVARADRLRLSPVLHVNQVGYMPEYPKQAMVGYYLGSLGELDLSRLSEFHLLDSKTGKSVFHGPLKSRLEGGWETSTLPYQHVLEADFSEYRVPGEYRLWTEGIGASLPFRIDGGTVAAFARTYALGLYHQRCGAENALPFTRFVHAACHTAPADVPTMENKSVQRQLTGESGNYKDNPRHTAPQLKDVNSSLYPFVRQGKVDVSGGHHDAGDYSKYTLNSAQLIHTLIFSADVFPGAAPLDNLGLPESGDGKSDLLQIAKWETDFLAKMQDDDGGFYFLVYPRDRAYENNVLPDHGDPQVVFPKTTSATAAAVAALAQAASSPGFQQAYPEAAKLYLQKAQKGWAFLERAWAKYSRDGAYQKITHYGDFAMQDDESAWAATELYLATGERKYHDILRKLFDPSDKNTRHWTWERLFESYGCAVRSYAFAVQSGRMTAAQLDPVYLEKCRAEILAAAKDHQDWATANAYGTSFPTESKRFRTAGWYFSTAQAFDIAVADQLDPQPERMEAILGNLNFEAGCNPNNVVFVTGLGWKRQREIVHQYAMNDRRVLPPSGIPLGSVQEGFGYLENYKKELGALTFPPDGTQANPYPIYDRWGDSFNVSTEFTIPIQGRCLGMLAWLMARSANRTHPWRAAAAHITGMPARLEPGAHHTLSLQVEGLKTDEAQVVWEANGQEPKFGAHYDFTPTGVGAQWVEAEACWPDGRRAFAVFDGNVAAAPRPGTPALPIANPPFTAGVWKNITPPGVTMTAENHVFCQGMAIDPAHPSTLYLCVCAYDVSKGGLYKTTDGGATWAKMGNLDEPIHIAIDPHHSNHLYCVDGVRGATLGFWTSNDGGTSWTMPPGFVSATALPVGTRDLYSLAVDPTDFNHVLVSFHSPWSNSTNCGVLESRDGGGTWVVHNPPEGSARGYGMAIFFLYNPATKQGDKNTWLFTTQAGGFYRTTDAGATWTQCYALQMTHGGNQLYRTHDGVLYSGGYQYPVRSTDNGASWQQIKTGLVYSWYMGICGDGKTLYTACSNTNEPFFTSPEKDGLNWTPYEGGTQKFSAEPFEMAYDPANQIVYSASWSEGLLALRVRPSK